MSKLLIYLGEKQAFDSDVMMRTILSVPGTSQPRRGGLIGAAFECEYAFEGSTTIVRLSDDLETIVVEGLGREAATFAIELQRRLDLPMKVIDMEYSFNLFLRDYASPAALLQAMSKGEFASGVD